MDPRSTRVGVDRIVSQSRDSVDVTTVPRGPGTRDWCYPVPLADDRVVDGSRCPPDQDPTSTMSKTHTLEGRGSPPFNVN